MRPLAFPRDHRLRAAAAIAVASGFTACNAIFGITGAETGATSTGGGAAATSTSSAGGAGGATTTATATSTSTSSSTSSTSTTSTSSTTSTTTTTSSSSSGTGGGGPVVCDGSGLVGPVGTKGEWAKRTGGDGTESASAVVFAADGGMLAVGSYDNPATAFSLVPLPYPTPDGASEADDMFVTRYKPDGTPDWAVGFNGPLSQDPLGVAITPAGNLFVTGRMEGSVDFDQTTLVAQGLDGFIVKIDPQQKGKVLWAKRFGGPGDDLGQQVVVDSKSDVIIAGVTNGDPDLAALGCPASVSPAGAGAFLIKLDGGGGQCIWAQKYSVDTRFSDKFSTGFPISLAVDLGDDSVVMAGGAAAPNFGQGPLAYYGGKDVFVFKAKSNGDYANAKTFGAFNNDGTQFAGGVGVDPCGNVVLAGSFTGDLTFGGTTLKTKVIDADASDASSEDVFVAKLGPDLVPLWAKSFGDAGTQLANAVAVDARANVVVAGTITDAVDSLGVDFGAGLLLGPGPDPVYGYEYNLFVVKLDAAGGYLAAQRFGSQGGQTSRGVATNAAGRIALVGDFGTNGAQELAFGGTAIPLQSTYLDAFFTVLGP